MTSVASRLGQVTAIAFTAVNSVEIVGMPLQEPEEGEYRVRAEVSAVSPGTELRCLAGMQQTPLQFPFIPGYALVGIVESAGDGTNLPLGTRVLCDGTRRSSIPSMWGGHVSHALCREASVTVVPDGVWPESAAIAKLAAIAQRGVDVSHPQPGERVVVIGLGLIGLLSARLFASEGCRVLAMDRLPQRVSAARSPLISARLIKSTAAELVRDEFPEGIDILVDATGNEQALLSSIECCPILPFGDTRREGTRLVIQGSYPGSFTIPYQDAFMRELTILVPRDTRPVDKRAVLKAIAEGRLDVHDLANNRFCPSEAATAYRQLQSGEISTALFDWRS